MREYKVETGIAEEFLEEILNKIARDKTTSWHLDVLVPYQIFVPSLGAEQIRYTVIFITERTHKNV